MMHDKPSAGSAREAADSKKHLGRNLGERSAVTGLTDPQAGEENISIAIEASREVQRPHSIPQLWLQGCASPVLIVTAALTITLGTCNAVKIYMSEMC